MEILIQLFCCRQVSVMSQEEEKGKTPHRQCENNGNDSDSEDAVVSARSDRSKIRSLREDADGPRKSNASAKSTCSSNPPRTAFDTLKDLNRRRAVSSPPSRVARQLAEEGCAGSPAVLATSLAFSKAIEPAGALGGNRNGSTGSLASIARQRSASVSECRSATTLSAARL